MQSAKDLQSKTIKKLARECQSVEDVHAMLKSLSKDTLQ
jgi:putative transposase